MGVMDYFKPVESWTAEKVREYLRENDDATYALLDVRQPGEYEKGHLPGAILIPVGELEERVGELEPQKVTIVYCAAGVRSRAAASILHGAGFREVYSMSGGIHAWNGTVAEGFPEAGISWFAPARSVEELIALAWVLEDGTESFYRQMAEAATDPDAAAVFRDLVKAEGAHKQVLADLFDRFPKKSDAADIPTLLGGYPQQKVMEGGMRVSDAVTWAKGKNLKEILEMFISLETGSYDRYRVLQRRVNHDVSLEMFSTLASEEKRHLQLLTELFEKEL